MKKTFRTLSTQMLRQMTNALLSGSVTLTSSRGKLAQLVGPDRADDVKAVFSALHTDGTKESVLAHFLELIIEEREASIDQQGAVRLVWTGDGSSTQPASDTWVVVTELISRAQTEIILSSFVVYNSQNVFAALVSAMLANPSLLVKMFLHVGRDYDDKMTPEQKLIERFRKRFTAEMWPKECRLPEVYYDSRGLKLTAEERATLHAKVVIVDKKWALVTSANLTDAAQHKNIEAGVLVENTTLAQGLREQFMALLESGLFKPIPGLDLQASAE
jgi:phosphatidylserine/phosphatidylglycerophosphate/cardiolipin synthase-like enzyme